jgi:hypothetical protein
MNAQYNLDRIPDGVIPNNRNKPVQPGEIRWSGDFPIPKIGDRVNVIINDLGTGEVIGYFVEYNFLGLYVRLDHQPEWHKIQAQVDYAMPFGIDIERELS